MKLHLLEGRKSYGYTAWGCPWKQGEVQKGTAFYAQTEQVQAAVQTSERAYWPDGSVKWTAHIADSRLLQDGFEILPQQFVKQEAKQITITENDYEYMVRAGRIQAGISKTGNRILHDLVINGQEQLSYGELRLLLEEREEKDGVNITRTVPYVGEIESVCIEEQGPLAVSFCMRGRHRCIVQTEEEARRCLPFILRMTICYDSPKIDFVHTFFFDGEEEKDFMKGLGIRFVRSMKGELFNRHVRFAADAGSFHEALILLSSWRPRAAVEIYEKQIRGELLHLDPAAEADAVVLEASRRMPVWSRYQLCQDSATHFSIRKKIANPKCCYIEGLHGHRAPGGAAFGDETGGLMLAARDFWQKYPSGIELGDLDREEAEAILWLWTPQTEAMDFRHYADAGYSQTYYEGFDEVGATPYGIANTNSFSIEAFEGAIPDEARLNQLIQAVQKPPVYFADPQHYLDSGALGEWGLVSCETEVERYLEQQLDKAFDFYRNEIEVRSWYGMFNYGDIMHTYDRFRHCWRYDMGGYAWQNTELVPTYWLWYAFLRSGREDIYTMAEAMSRHCSEVDIYHFGPLKGLGSRHNVRHWGCSCKEARIAMAGHHRFYYYLTGDRRMGEVLDEVRDADEATVYMDPLRYFYDRDKMVYPTHARSGPDWSAYCSNWMTDWERTGQSRYRDKLCVGIEDLKQAPLKLTSGTDFEYNPADGHLRYIGERAGGGSHLQICMGGPQVWIELGHLLQDTEWLQMLAEHGRFYYLPREKQQELSGGLIGNREFSLPFMASGLAAFAAEYLQDESLAKTTWRILLHALCMEQKHEGFESTPVENAGNQKLLQEIPWISTNFTAQWCLNVITALRYIRGALPKTMEEMDQLLQGLGEEGFRKA